MQRPRSIHRVFISYIIGVIAVTLIGLCLTWIWSEVRRHQQARKSAYARFRSAQDGRLKGEMDKVFEFISLNRVLYNVKLKNELKQHADEAVALAGSIMQKSPRRMTQAETQHLIVETLRQVRFLNGRGFYFILRDDGTVILNPLSPAEENKNMINLTNSHGLKVVKEIIETANKSGQGYITAWWSEVPGNDTAASPGISYVRKFSGLGWVIGCASYDGDAEAELSRELLISLLTKLKTEKKSGLLFNLDGKVLINNIPDMKLPGGYIWNFADGNELPLFQMIRDSALIRGDGFVNYHFTDFLTGEQHLMRLYSRFVPEWKQVIVLAENSDSIRGAVDVVVAESYHKIGKQLLQLMLFISFILLLILIVSRWFSRRIQRGLNLFSSRMTVALKTKGAVNTAEFQFLELQQLANSFNSILRQREKVLSELADSEQRYRMIATNVSDVIFTLTRSFQLSYVSPSVNRLLGYQPDVAQTTMPESFIDIQDHRRMRILVVNMMTRRVRNPEHQRGGTIEMELRHAEGKKVPVEIFVNPVTDASGSFLYLLGVARDISERWRAQRELLESEERYRLISSNVRDVIWSCNRYFEFTYISPAVFPLTGYGTKELLGTSIQALLTPESFLALMNKLNEAGRPGSGRKKNQQGSVVMEAEHQRRDRTRFYAEISASVVFDDRGKAIGYNGITRDITERKKASDELRLSESKLRDINAAKDKFFSIIAHDLRNPFGSLLGFTSVLSDRFDDFSDSEKLTIINQLRFASESAYRLIENLLEWSRTQTNSVELLPTLFDLSPLVNESLRLHATQAERKRIQLINDLPAGVYVYADRNMIGTVIRNLVSNAVKFSLERGKVMVMHETTDEMITLSVVDEGIGIPAQNIPKLFRIDEKIKTSGTFNEPGSGLGLILCREFIIRNGGMIWVESTSGRGSKFSFCLPRK